MSPRAAHTDRARRVRLPVLVVLTAILAAGCAGINDPYQTTTTHQANADASTRAAGRTAAADSGDPAGERGGTIPASVADQQSQLHPGAGDPTPRAAIARYTTLWVNWSAQSIREQQRQLAQISLGQARAQALPAAASLQNDTQLTQSQVSNTGRLISASEGQGPAAGRWVVVTEETTSGQGDYQGLPPSVHVIYAQLTHTSQGWVISGWSAQN